MARYRILSWDGIPAQLKVEADGEQAVSVQLSDWFMQEIDRVAMRKGMIGSDAYLEQWGWGPWLERDGTPEQVAAALAAELEAEWEPVRMRQPRPDDEV